MVFSKNVCITNFCLEMVFEQQDKSNDDDNDDDNLRTQYGRPSTYM